MAQASETTGKAKDLRKSHFFKTGPERASVWLLAGMSLRHDPKGQGFQSSWPWSSFLFHFITDWWQLPRTPSYRGSTTHGGGPSAQVEEINEIPDPEARHEEQVSRCLRLSRGPSSLP